MTVRHGDGFPLVVVLVVEPDMIALRKADRVPGPWKRFWLRIRKPKSRELTATQVFIRNSILTWQERKDRGQ